MDKILVWWHSLREFYVWIQNDNLEEKRRHKFDTNFGDLKIKNYQDRSYSGNFSEFSLKSDLERIVWSDRCRRRRRWNWRRQDLLERFDVAFHYELARVTFVRRR